ncbi:MAG: methyltransferase domain-containing protein [bacterium]
MRSPILSERARALFDAKGPENAARVRRVLRLLGVVHGRAGDLTGLRVLDLGCGEGVFAIEAALAGASVLGIDGRAERMDAGRAVAAELGLDGVELVNADLRAFPFEERGPFDVVLALGVLYHLTARELVEVVGRVAHVAARAAVVETHVARGAVESVELQGQLLRGWHYREHRAEDASETRQQRRLASLDNEWSFWPTAASLCELLEARGFGAVLECRVPEHPAEGLDRRTFLALKTAVAPVRTYPWIDGMSAAEMRARSRSPRQLPFHPPLGSARESAVLATTVALGAWIGAGVGFRLGLASIDDPSVAGMRPPDVALWRDADLDDAVGGLGRVPPVLAVLVADRFEDREALRVLAAQWVAAGCELVWIVDPESRRAQVVDVTETRAYEIDDVLPQSRSLAGLEPTVRELLGRPRERSPSRPGEPRWPS